MDRKYIANATVHVYQSNRCGQLLDVFAQQPHSLHGFDNFEYKGAMYRGYIDWHGDGRTYILLDKPLN